MSCRPTPLEITVKHDLDDLDDRGDIPGWVLITIMTAGLVTLVWGVASDQLQNILTNALNSVTGP